MSRKYGRLCFRVHASRRDYDANRGPQHQVRAGGVEFAGDDIKIVVRLRVAVSRY
jgi:hypothetical protein